jgi:putative endonuclease
MYYVYILQSIAFPESYYIGFSEDLRKRLAEHNAGKSIHTNKYMPWRIKNYFAFDDKEKAEKFEVYLKSGSGRSFVKKHF